MSTINVRDEAHEAKQYALNIYDRLKGQADRENRPLSRTETAMIEGAKDRAVLLQKRVDAQRSDQHFFAALDKTTGGLLPADSRAVRGSTLGAQFARASGDWLKDRKNRPSVGQWSSPMVEFDDPRFGGELHATTITTSQGGSGGIVVVPQYLPDIQPVPTRRIVVADLLGSGPTASNLIVYMQETSYTNAAAAVAEGAAKPESAIVFAQVQEAVAKIAHWIPATDELLEDVPAMAEYINTRLITGVQLTEDDQLLNGNGVAPNMLGLLNRTGLAADQPRGSDTNVDAVAKQIAAIETANPDATVTGVIMHPTNYLSSRLMKSTLNTYIGGDPFQPVMTPALWGVPVAVTPAIPLGTALVACRSKAMVFRRSGITVLASNSHQDFFIKNLVAIRAELRAALCVFRPAAFGRVTGLN